MRVLIGCEFSGVVRDAFLARGHDAWSCDLLPTERPGPHLQIDVLEALGYRQWTLAILHPPCTYLCRSGARWHAKSQQKKDALRFVELLLSADVPKICLENPIGAISTFISKPDQIIQPWQFGHPETKSTCLWLKGLPLLTPTNIVTGRESRIHRANESKIDPRWKQRSRTLPGIAAAMAEQWG